MSDDEADPELLELLRQSLGLGAPDRSLPPETKVLVGAEHVYNNAIDVAIDSRGTKAAAQIIWSLMQQKEYSTKTWATHELHPTARDESTVEFILTMDLLNFSFWSDSPSETRFAIEYRGKKWTGYWSLVAALQRAIDEGVPITNSDFWQNQEEFTEETLGHVFRSATDEQIPLLSERLDNLRGAGKVLYEKYDCSFVNCIKEANGSAAALVNILADNFSCFKDEIRFEGKTIRILKRAQILVADLWACFEGQSFGAFTDIDKITMFAGNTLQERDLIKKLSCIDYRVPQMLHTLGCLMYSPVLDNHIRQRRPIPFGHSWEVQLRGCSIWCVELVKREIQRVHPEVEVNAILIDFFLYDTMKEQESAGNEEIPHHRTRSIWY